MMNYRNARYTAAGDLGRVDCEIELRPGVWVPFTATEGDTGAQFDVAELLAQMTADKAIAPALDADPAVALAAAQASGRARMVAWIDDFLSQFTAKYPKHERDAWPLLAIAAKAHLAGEPQRMILNEAAIVGADPDTVAAYIVEKHETLADIVDHARGLRQVTEKAIMAATSPAEVEAALSIAQGQALDMLDAIMNPEPVVEL